MKRIKIQKISKDFFSLRGRIRALDAITFEIEPGEFFVLLGPSGCGKSTLLNIIAGIENPSEGTIWINDKIMVSTESRIFATPRERNVAMVFQSYALYPHMNVFENIAFPLKIAKITKKEIATRIEKVSAMLKISHLLKAKPSELSGGQKQRVAIGRAIVRRPDVLLLDEPLSNLDAQLRIAMRVALKELQRELGISTIYVTHDQTEALTLGDRIAVMKNGRIQQIGSPDEVYKNPVTVFVGRFIGTPPMNLLSVDLLMNIRKKLKISNQIRIDQIIAGVRPEHVRITRKDKGLFPARISFIGSVGTETFVHVKIENYEIISRVSGSIAFKEGDTVGIDFDEKNVLLFNGKNEQRINL